MYGQFFKENLLGLLPEDHVINWLFKEVVPQDKIRSLLEGFFEETPSLDRLLLLSFVVPQFFSKEDPLYVKVLRHIKVLKGVEKTYTKTLVHLALLLLKEIPEEEFSIATLPSKLPLVEENPFMAAVSLPSPYEYLRIALFSWMIFLESGDEKGKEVALGIAEWQKNFVTEEGISLTSPWMKEDLFSRADLYIWNYLLFQALLGESSLTEGLYTQIEELSMELLERVDPLTYFIAEYLEAKRGEGAVLNPSPHYFEDLGAAVFQNSAYSWGVSVLGHHTGLGSFAKKKTQIVSFGPHFFPLGEIRYYGIERNYNPLEGASKDLLFEMGEEGFFFQGWTKAVYVPEEGRLWLKATLIQGKDALRLQIQTEHLNQKNPFAFVFFVSAKSAEIGSQVKLCSSSLDRYVGQKEAIYFSSGEEKLLIEPQFSTEQEVIPLAGMNHFWGADFLVAHTIPLHNQIYEWIIK